MPSVLHRQAEAGGHRRSRRALRAPIRPARQEVLSGRGVGGADRLAPLRAAKLRALVGAQWNDDPIASAVAGSLPGGATLVEGGTGRAWVLIDDAEPAGLGPALVWAGRQGARSLDVLVDDGAGAEVGARASGIIARRAAEWADGPAVWRVDGRRLVPAPPAAVTPPPAVPAPAFAFADVLRAHGADPVVEHGELFGEVLGLEVARVVPRDGGWRLEVGVGRLDRSARAEMRPAEADGTAIDEVVQVVRTWRRASAPRHPANTLSRERWLRAALIAHPGLAGAVHLAEVAPPQPRLGLRQGAAAPAAGTAVDGSPVIVVCSTGVDVDLVPVAADTRCRRDGPQAATRLVIVVPEGDDYPVTRSLAATLRHPADVVTVRRDWAVLTDSP